MALAPLENSSDLSTSLEEALECPVCLAICIRPCTTSCGHSFCRKCLRSAMAIGPQKRCPTCRQDLRGTDLVINRALWAVIQTVYPSICAAAPDSPAIDPKAAPPARRGRTVSTTRLGQSAASATAFQFIPPRPIANTTRASTLPGPAPAHAATISAATRENQIHVSESSSTNNTQITRGRVIRSARSSSRPAGLPSFRQAPTTPREPTEEPVGSLVDAIRSLNLRNNSSSGNAPSVDACPEIIPVGEVEVIDLTADQDSEDEEEGEVLLGNAARGVHGSRSTVRLAASRQSQRGLDIRSGRDGMGQASRPRSVVSGLFYGAAPSRQRQP